MNASLVLRCPAALDDSESSNCAQEMNFSMFPFALETLEFVHTFLYLMMISSEERGLFLWVIEAKLLLKYSRSVCMKAEEGN